MDDLSKRLREMAVNACSSEGVTVDDMVAGLTRAADALDARWQTMETAPKDGTWLLGYTPSTAWRGDAEPGWQIHPMQWARYAYGGMTWVGSHDGRHQGCTHWQPLPPPPEDA